VVWHLRQPGRILGIPQAGVGDVHVADTRSAPGNLMASRVMPRRRISGPRVSLTCATFCPSRRAEGDGFDLSHPDSTHTHVAVGMKPDASENSAL